MAATFALLLLLILYSSARAAPDAVVSRIAFGSCANQSEPQPIWDAVVGFDPQVFVWLGDNIYGDNKRPFRVFGRERTVGPWKNVPRFYPSTEEELRRRYQLARAQPGYARLRERAQKKTERRTVELGSRCIRKTASEVFKRASGWAPVDRRIARDDRARNAFLLN